MLVVAHETERPVGRKPAGLAGAAVEPCFIGGPVLRAAQVGIALHKQLVDMPTKGGVALVAGVEGIVLGREPPPFQPLHHVAMDGLHIDAGLFDARARFPPGGVTDQLVDPGLFEQQLAPPSRAAEAVGIAVDRGLADVGLTCGVRQQSPIALDFSVGPRLDAVVQFFVEPGAANAIGRKDQAWRISIEVHVDGAFEGIEPLLLLLGHHRGVNTRPIFAVQFARGNGAWEGHARSHGVTAVAHESFRARLTVMVPFWWARKIAAKTKRHSRCNAS